MSEPVARFVPWRHFYTFGFLALALGCVSAWLGRYWIGSYVVAGLFVISALVLFLAAARPAIEIHDRYIRTGNDIVPWNQIRRLDRTGWISPLVVYLTLVDDRRIQLIYPSNLVSCAALLRQLRRNSKEALIDGVPYQQYWGELYPQAAPQGLASTERPVTAVEAVATPQPTTSAAVGVDSRRKQEPPKYRLLRQEDEDEVIRLYQRLKSVGHMDPKDRSTGEN